MRRLPGRRERGSALVELALLVPFLFLMVFGIIEFGIAYSNKISVVQGVREGARQGVVDNVSGSCGSGALQGQILCVTKQRSSVTASKERVYVSVPNGYQQGSSILVCAEYPVDSLSGLMSPFLGGKTIHAKSEMRVERADATGLSSGGDAALDGSWSWCAPS